MGETVLVVAAPSVPRTAATRAAALAEPSPARGIAFGLLLVAPFWAAVGWFVLR